MWAYSTKRAVRDSKTLTLQENRAKAVVAGEKTARTPRFVKTRNGAAELDEASLARARRLVGLKGYVTNIPATLMPAGEVIASYHDLWHVEQSFRMSKTDLRARPMFARTRDAIEAHLTIVFTALAVSREVQNRTGLSLRRLLRTLKPLRSATIEINGVITTIPPALSPDEQAILNALQAPTAKALSRLTQLRLNLARGYARRRRRSAVNVRSCNGANTRRGESGQRPSCSANSGLRCAQGSR